MEPGSIYQLRPAEVYQALETSPTGLSNQQAEERVALFGPNLLTEEYRPPAWKRFVSQVFYPMALLMLAVGVIGMLFQQYFLGTAIFTLVLVNAGFSWLRTYRVEQAMDALRRLLPEYTRLLRDGAEIDLPASQVVPGDVLILAEGDNIPADARVVEEYGLRTNNATLTGDAVPARKAADASFREGISELERPNLVFAGTSVVSGTGRAVVYSTGMLTNFGRIAHLTQTVEEEPSPIQQELSRVMVRISLIAFIIGGSAALIGFFDPTINLKGFEAVILGLGIIVAAIPEGLPATLTLALAMAGQRLANQGVLVKKLSVLETLGTISTICTDKSGTLTQNQMTVREIWAGGQTISISGVGYEPAGNYLPDPHGRAFEPDLRQLLTAITCCNNSRLTPPGPGKPHWSYLGDQTEAALRVAAMKAGLKEEQINRQLPRIHELPFDARRKRMTTIHQPTAGFGATGEQLPNPLAFVKGAPRELLALCNSIMIEGKIAPLSGEQRQKIMACIDDFAGRALRVLGVAQHQLPPGSRAFGTEAVEQDLTFLGLVAMHDPPRLEVEEAIQTLRLAGIRLIMITGDYGLTALSLARRVGMLSSDNPQIVTGAELDQLNEFRLKELLALPELLFARMTPEHKLRVVAAIQDSGEVVAVTGDGVNDAPALRRADVGISMGLTGTDVSKEAADIILIDDNFANVVDAIREGRTLYDNLRKFITYIFSSNVPEVLPFLIHAVTHIPLAMGFMQILAVDLGTDLIPSLGLSSEKPEPDVMRRKPRPRGARVIDSGLLQRAFLWLGMIEATLCYLGFFMVYLLSDRMYLVSGWLTTIHPPTWEWLQLSYFMQLTNDDVYRLAVTVFYAGVVMAQVGNVFACRAEVNRSTSLGWFSNRSLWVGIAISLAQLLLVVYWLPLHTVFDHAPLPLWMWLWLTPYGLILYGLEWIRKAAYRRFSSSRQLAGEQEEKQEA